MKRLYLRFYVNATSPIPFSEHLVCNTITDESEFLTHMEEHKDETARWLFANKNGKVEFVWV